MLHHIILFLIVQDHKFCPQRFAIAVVKEEVGSQGTVSERTPTQQHHHPPRLRQHCPLLLNRYAAFREVLEQLWVD